MQKFLMFPVWLVVVFISITFWFLPSIFCFRVYKNNKSDQELTTFSKIVLIVGIVLVIPALMLSFLFGALMLTASLTFFTDS